MTSRSHHHHHRYYYLRLFLFAAVAMLLLCTPPGSAQINNSGALVENPTKERAITHDSAPASIPGTTHTVTAPPPAIITIYINGSIPLNGTLINITAPPMLPPTTTSYVLPPVPVQPFTTQGVGAFPTPSGPLPLPTTPAWFPQNISSCTMCYGQFQTLSRCNALANEGLFPVTTNTTYAELMPFLKCICTYKALDMYPYCIDCLSRTQQLNQLNVLQAYHLESYQDAFHQLCGSTFNGNKIPGSSGAVSTKLLLSRHGIVGRWVLPLMQLVLGGAVAMISFVFV
ncbi:hypothetical protein DFQ26_005529 [Actinomortierella ambigua]|nr:hypothetical protein DFQ26_005529 [Actinomortierella ambigua]